MTILSQHHNAADYKPTEERIITLDHADHDTVQRMRARVQWLTGYSVIEIFDVDGGEGFESIAEVSAGTGVLWFRVTWIDSRTTPVDPAKVGFCDARDNFIEDRLRSTSKAALAMCDAELALKCEQLAAAARGKGLDYWRGHHHRHAMLQLVRWVRFDLGHEPALTTYERDTFTQRKARLAAIAAATK